MAELNAIDWDNYSLWHDTTSYSTTLVVAQQHPDADDANDGSAVRPLATIQAALDRVQAGQRIQIHRGIYRELLTPKSGGTGTDAMISIEAAAGEEVIVSGSRMHTAEWNRPRTFDEDFDATTAEPSMSQRVWRTTVDLEHCGDYQPLALMNVEPEDEVLMDWMEPVSGRSPFTLKRVMLVQNGERLTQLNHPGDVGRVPGSFWVDQDNASLLVHPAGSTAPHHHCFEVAMQSHLLCPEQIGLNYIRVSGIIFQHCANGFLRASTGAITTRGGGYWLIENCTVRQVNSSGIEFGDMPFEWRDQYWTENRNGFKALGNCIVRNNTVSECGTAGIRCLKVTEGRVLYNHIHHCGWQDAGYYYECAGIKLLVNNHTLVAHNTIEYLIGACGIWMDWDNEYSRVSHNTIRHIDSLQGGIFIEASPIENLIDHNTMWRIDGPGIFGGDSSNQIYRFNLIANCSKNPMTLFCHTDREVRGQQVTCMNNTVHGNIFINPVPFNVAENNNNFRGNTWVFDGLPGLDIDAWQQRGFDHDLQIINGSTSLRDYDWALSWNWDSELRADTGPVPMPGTTGETALT